MEKLSPSTSAIESIIQSLAQAAQAAQRLDPAHSQDLVALIRLASTEAGRFVKTARKAAMPKKAVAKTVKKASKPAPVIEVKASLKPAKSRRKVSPPNGAATH